MTDRLEESLVKWRRHLHAHPEPSLHEHATAAFVCARLSETWRDIYTRCGWDRRRRDAVTRRLQSDSRPTRRHGCIADPRNDRAALCLDACRRDACLRP